MADQILQAMDENILQWIDSTVRSHLQVGPGLQIEFAMASYTGIVQNIRTQVSHFQPKLTASFFDIALLSNKS